MRTTIGLAMLVFAALGCGKVDARPRPSHDNKTAMTAPAAGHPRTYRKPSPAELEKLLTPLQLDVTQRAGTEPPFANAYWDNHAPGLYVDVVTGEPLFSSQDKFDSGTGWPSFTRPLEPASVVSAADSSGGMDRTEVRSRVGGSHLGHVFPDGPAPTGQRYCINSAALRFIPAAELEAQGYGDYAARFAARETAILAGGCFWGMEKILRAAPGVVSVEVGYAGGASTTVSYEDVETGTTGHAESVRVVFDPAKLSYADLLTHWYFRGHDPTSLDRQNNDVGPQYRSEIFTTSAAQRATALAVKAKVEASGMWGKPIVTRVEPATTFVRAEEYHQDFLVKHPDGYDDHYLRAFDF